DFVVYGETEAGGPECVCEAAFAGARRPGRRRRVLLAGDSMHGAFEAAARAHSDVLVSALPVDQVVQQMVREPERLDIIAIDHVYAGVVSKLGMALAGGTPLSAWAGLGPRPMFVGTDMGAFLAAAMMLEHLGLAAEAARVETAVRRAIGEDSWTQ